MDLSRLQGIFRRHRAIVVFAVIVMLAAGFDLLLNPPERGRIEILSIPFIVGAFFLLAVLLWPRPGKVKPERLEPTLASRFLNKVTFNGKLVPFFPLMGIILISLDVVYNAFISPSPTLQIHDTIVLLFAISLISYPFVPQRFNRERDFVLLFFFVLVLILVVPLLAIRLYQGNFEEGVNIYSRTMLAPQLQVMLSLIGIPSTVGPDPWGSSAPGLLFTPQQGEPIWVVITTACSGIYSFSIFASAFTAFVLVELKKLNWRVWVLLLLGFVAAYFANLLRMTVIVIAGYISQTPEESINSMMIAHSNAGWLIFLGWISLFWLLIFRFIFPKKEDALKIQEKKLALCPICNEPLSPTIPGTRCVCGSLYHSSCIQKSGQCLNCQRQISRTKIEEKSLT